MYITCFIQFLQREDGKFIDLQLGVNMKNTEFFRIYHCGVNSASWNILYVVFIVEDI